LRRPALLLAATLVAMSTSVIQPGVAFADEAPSTDVTQAAVETTVEPAVIEEAPPAAVAAGPVVEAPPAAVEEPVTAVVTEEAAPVEIVAPVEEALSLPVPVAETTDVADSTDVPVSTDAVAPAAGPAAAPLPAPRPKPLVAPRVLIATGGVDEPLITAGETSTYSVGLSVPPGALISTVVLNLFSDAACTVDVDFEAFTNSGTNTFTTTSPALAPGTYYWQAKYDNFTFDFSTVPPGFFTTSDATVCGAAGSVVTVVAAADPVITSQPSDLLVGVGDPVSFEVRFTCAPVPTSVGWEFLDENEVWMPFDLTTPLTGGDVADGFVSSINFPAALDLDGLLLRAALGYVPVGGGAATTLYSNEVELVVLAPLDVVTVELPDATVGQAYEEQLQADGGTGLFAWDLAPGTRLPNGLSLDEDGFVSGTPTEEGLFAIPVEVVDLGAELLLSPAARVRPRLSLAPLSAAVTLTVLPPVAAGTPASVPRNVSAFQTGPGEVTISWTAPASTGSGPITGYSVGYGNGGSGNGGMFGPTVRQAVFNGLNVGDYQASVVAITAAGDSPRATDPFTIVADFTTLSVGGSLPITGANSSENVTLATWLVLAGIVMTVGTRVRRTVGTALQIA